MNRTGFRPYWIRIRFLGSRIVSQPVLPILTDVTREPSVCSQNKTDGLNLDRSISLLPRSPREETISLD